MAAMMPHRHQMAEYCPYCQKCNCDKNFSPAFAAATVLTFIFLFVFIHFYFPLKFPIFIHLMEIKCLAAQPSLSISPIIPKYSSNSDNFLMAKLNPPEVNKTPAKFTRPYLFRP